MGHNRRRVVAELTPGVVGVRAYHCNRFQVFPQGKQIIFVLQKYYAFAGDLEREFLMLW